MIKVKTVQQRRDINRRHISDNERRSRAKLKANSINISRTEEERMLSKKLLNARDRNTSQVRVVNRCVETGRGRSVIRMFRRSRYVIRDRIRNGELPGFTKAS